MLEAAGCREDSEMRIDVYKRQTHDNFSALVLGSESIGVAIDQILDVLAKLIRNPVAAFNRQLDCIGASEGAERSLEIQKDEMCIRDRGCSVREASSALKREAEDHQHRSEELCRSGRAVWLRGGSV